MRNWLRRLSQEPEPEAEAERRPEVGEAGGEPAEQILALQGEIQSLRLELDARQRQIARLQADLERFQGEAQAAQEARAEAQWEQFLSEAAGPVAQLLTQAHLLEAEGKPLTGRDVLAVARRLVQALEARGLEAAGPVGEETSYDPDQHEALSAQTAVERGQRVRVRFPGLVYRGRVVRKAGVTPVE